MQLWRIEFGLWKSDRKPTLKDWLGLGFDHAYCGCHLLTVGRFYITYLGDECYLPDDPNPEDPLIESDNS
jgi:hypothetical protein